MISVMDFPYSGGERMVSCYLANYKELRFKITKKLWNLTKLSETVLVDPKSLPRVVVSVQTSIYPHPELHSEHKLHQRPGGFGNFDVTFSKLATFQKRFPASTRERTPFKKVVWEFGGLQPQNTASSTQISWKSTCLRNIDL